MTAGVGLGVDGLAPPRFFLAGGDLAAVLALRLPFVFGGMVTTPVGLKDQTICWHVFLVMSTPPDVQKGIRDRSSQQLQAIGKLSDLRCYSQ